VFPIALPPLRERLEDIPLLVRHFVRKFADRMNKEIHSIPDEVIEVLKHHSWPGNIRELQNFLERAVILSSGTVLCAPLGDLESFTDSQTPSAGRTLKDAERAHIMEVLREVGWIVGGHRGAAVRLGLPRTTLLHRMRKLGITPEAARQNAC
jgi:formate hydrogenlyase transcriptional activator